MKQTINQESLNINTHMQLHSISLKYDPAKIYPKGHCVYIMLCADNTLYTGWTNDFNSRVSTHNQGKGAKYTRARLPVVPVYLEYVSSRSHGLKREAAIKKLSRLKKIQLISSDSNQL